MQRNNVDRSEFTPAEQEFVETAITELAPVFGNPQVREVNTFIEGGVGRGVLPLLLLKELTERRSIKNPRYIGIDLIGALSSHNRLISSMTVPQIAQYQTQPPFSAHGAIQYVEANGAHCISGTDFYEDNNILEGDCFNPKDVQKVVQSFPNTQPIFFCYNAIGALFSSKDSYAADRWFDQQLPYLAWIFLTHLPTPWEVNEPATDSFYFYRQWYLIQETCIKLNLSVYLLGHGLAAVRM